MTTKATPPRSKVPAGRERRTRQAQVTQTDFGDRLALRPPPEDEQDRAWCWQPERRMVNRLTAEEAQG